MAGKRVVGLIQCAIEFLIDVAHLQQFHVGEIKQSADIVTFAVHYQCGVPIHHRDVVGAVGKSNSEGILHFLTGERLPPGAKNLRDQPGVI